MALMFPRLARNFVKNGYFPTDEPTLERALAALAAADNGPMCILDPCAGEGVAIAEAAHALGREQVKAFAVEFDAERARHARGLVDHCLHADLMDTLITRQSFGLLWLNPPYGDLAKNADGSIDVYLQQEAPTGHEQNWLPTPSGKFKLMLRAYLPGAAILNGTYRVPQVVKAQ